MSHKNPEKFTVLNCACVIALACAVQLVIAVTSRGQDGEARPPSKGKLSTVPAQPLNWPLPANVDKSYDSIDGHRLHVYVEELAAISEKYHDATFGVTTQIAGAVSAGQLARLQFDAPSFYLHNKGVYYHCDQDTPDKVPESTLRNAVQAFAKIFNDVNKLDLKDLQPPPSTAALGAGSHQRRPNRLFPRSKSRLHRRPDRHRFPAGCYANSPRTARFSGRID